jgi:PAS domain-containing protein
VALLDRPVRDRCWVQVDADPDHGWLVLWRHLARRALPPYRTEPLFLLAWTAWRRGDPATARVALGCARGEDPAHRASLLLGWLLSTGTDPRLLPSLAADRPARYRPPATAVAIAGDEAVLAAAQDTIEVLVGQAALALHRVGVTDETSRRDRDAYLSAVGERTADVVILLDSDEWIRYASPSLVDLLRVPAPVFATWRDIFHRDDQAQVENTLDRARAVFDGTGVTTEWTLRRADGSWIQVAVDCRDLRDHSAVQGLVITMRDITDDRRVDLPSTLRRLDRSAPGRNRRSVWRRFG